MSSPKSRKGARATTVTGRISMTRRGYGFVRGEHGDYFVSGRDVNGALHGDIVALRPDTKRSAQGRSGVVVRIVERAFTSVVGRFERHGSIGIVTPADSRIRAEVFIASNGIGDAKTGDIVVAALTGYPSRNTQAQGYITEIVGRDDDPGIRIEVIIREHGLLTEFTPEASFAAESLKLDVDATLATDALRRDIRDRFTFTIDPVDARDFDDAISIEHVDGFVRLGVHIADVSHYVPWDSPIDSEARMRATSVYLVDRVLPMLPEKLSNDICSLNPDEDRLAFSVDMLLDKDGVIRGVDLYPSAIRSDLRLDYDRVQRMLDGEESFPDEPSEEGVRGLARASAALGARRIARGGLDFETVEAKVRLDSAGVPTEVVLRERTQATNMIEEAMIAANEAVARHMRDAVAPMVYRIHEPPQPDALESVGAVLKEFDYPMRDVGAATPATFQRIVSFAHDRPEKRLINSLLLRALERARYSAELQGHFGLASDAYTHFTSPIRRYPDLIVHRLLRAQLSATLESDRAMLLMAAELPLLAEHASFMEREAEAAEDESVRFKLCELMAGHVGEEFSAFVTGVASYGLFVQLENTAEGLVHVEALGEDRLRYDGNKHALIAERRGVVYRLGSEIRVRLVNVSLGDVRMDFEPV